MQNHLAQVTGKKLTLTVTKNFTINILATRAAVSSGTRRCKQESSQGLLMFFASWVVFLLKWSIDQYFIRYNSGSLSFRHVQYILWVFAESSMLYLLANLFENYRNATVSFEQTFISWRHIIYSVVCEVLIIFFVEATIILLCNP